MSSNLSDRDPYLLRAGYEAGYLNASLAADDGRNPLGNNLEEQSGAWIDEVIADNGGTVGDFVVHHAPDETGGINNV